MYSSRGIAIDSCSYYSKAACALFPSSFASQLPCLVLTPTSLPLQLFPSRIGEGYQGSRRASALLQTDRSACEDDSQSEQESGSNSGVAVDLLEVRPLAITAPSSSTCRDRPKRLGLSPHLSFISIFVFLLFFSSPSYTSQHHLPVFILLH